MSILTTFFNLIKPSKSDGVKVKDFNDNMDIIDTEMHKPPLTVNGVQPDPTSRNCQLNSVPLADNLTSDEAQVNDGTYIVRTSGGEASINDGGAFLSQIKGNMKKTGYSAQVCDMTVTNAERPDPDDPVITATINPATFRDEVDNTTGVYAFVYSTSWTYSGVAVTLADYGITVDGTPYAGDTITVDFAAENRGTITAATPSDFISTGWNLYNHSDPDGKIRVCRYSETYGYKIAGDYTLLQFSTAASGAAKTQIIPVSGMFNVPSDGWLFVSGGNATNTMVWTTWSDWTVQPNGGVFEAYSEASIDLSGVMANFPYGLMAVGSVADEINLNTGIAYSRIERLTYNAENLAAVIASGVAYDTDTGYIFAVRESAELYDASGVSGEYTVDAHGIEYYLSTTVALTSQSLYGENLKDKLRRDVLTISAQALTDAQKEQARENIGAVSADQLATKMDKNAPLFFSKQYSTTSTVSVNSNAEKVLTYGNFGITPIEGYIPVAIVSFSGKAGILLRRFDKLSNDADSGATIIAVRNVTGSTISGFTPSITLLYVKSENVTTPPEEGT